MNDLIQKLTNFRDAYLRGEISLDDYKAGFASLTGGMTDPNSIQMLGVFSPNYVANQKGSVRQASAMQSYDTTSGILDIARQLGLTSLVAEQIASSNRGLAQPAPGVPTPPPANPVLQQRLYDAQRRAADVSYATDPAKQNIEQGYLSGLQQAQAASGGQAASYNANANLLNLQRMQQGLQLAPIAQQARIQNEGVVSDYLGQQMGETQNRFANQMAANQVLQQRYDAGQKAYGEAGAYGRFNLANIMQNFRLPEYFNWMNVDEETRDMMSRAKKRRAALDVVKSVQGGGGRNFNPDMNPNTIF